MGIEEHVAVRCAPGTVQPMWTPDTQASIPEPRIYLRAGAQVNQDQPLLNAISRTLKRLGVPHQVERGEPFTADRNPRMDIVVRGGLRNAPNPEYRGKSILVNLTHADPQAQVHLRAGSADHDRPAASSSEVRKRQHYARPGHASFDKRRHKVTTLRGGKFWASRGRR